MKTEYRRDAGFTLIEILVVVVIIGILAGLVVPRIIGRPGEARQAKARMQLESLQTALRLFKMDNGFYPATEQGLEALVNKPAKGRVPESWREGGYLESNYVPKDPWGNEFVYLSPGVHNKDFDLMSLGADKEIGGESEDADVTNWEEAKTKP
ncbi:MAG: type II secretion system major pseudopilin GspG [Thermodesulfobacteriota bacterium]